MKTLKAKGVWCAMVYPGGGGRKILGYFTKQADALAAGKGKGEWGNDGTASLTDLDIRIYESLAEYEAGERDRARAAARAKLTAEEARLLGLED